MKAHWLNDGEQVLVTGTLDPDAAIAYLDAEAAKCSDEQGTVHEYDPIDMADLARTYGGRGERGIVLPSRTSDHPWFWHFRKDGRCRGVVFG